MATPAIRFYHRGQIQEVSGTPITRTVLQYLREDARCTGTKEGCAAGDCGACTVVIGELQAGSTIAFKAVNSCLQFLPTLDGKALITVEDLCQPDGSLHPVQEAMVTCHGSQCGFCTPGFVMSLWALYQQHQPGAAPLARPTVCDALTGNLCRCTGYRPIIEAGLRMLTLPAPPPGRLDPQAIAEALRGLQRQETFHYRADSAHFYAPRSLSAFAALRQAEPGMHILAGSTDMGLWVTKQCRDLGNLLYVGHVAELQEISRRDGLIEIGAAVTLERAFAVLTEAHPALLELWKRFASLPIRNVGTLGGNIAHGSPIGDSMPALIALGAEVVLQGSNTRRTLPLADLYLANQQNAMSAGEFVAALRVPDAASATAPQHFRAYKLSKRRFDEDMSTVCAAFGLTLASGVIQQACIAYGGMAATPKRAAHAEAALAGQPWSVATVQAAMDALAQDYPPQPDRRTSSGYRARVAANLLYRFWLETCDNALAPEAVNVRAPAADASALT